MVSPQVLETVCLVRIRSAPEVRLSLSCIASAISDEAKKTCFFQVFFAREREKEPYKPVLFLDGAYLRLIFNPRLYIASDMQRLAYIFAHLHIRTSRGICQ